MPMPFNLGADAVRSTPELVDLGDDFFAVKSAQNARNKLRGFGKAWNVGSQLAVFYPFHLIQNSENPEQPLWAPCLSVVYGHKCDHKIFKRAFLRSRCELDADQNIVGAGDLPYQFSRVSYLLVRAQKEAELAALAKKDWSMLGQDAYQTTRQQVEDKYDPKRMSGIKPIIQRFSLQRNTVCYTVALDGGTPKMRTQDSDNSKTGYFTHTLSEGRMGKLVDLANDPLMGVRAQHPDQQFAVGDVSYLEVHYNFSSARMDKADAGKADPQGVAASITLMQRFPDLKPQILEALKGLPTSSADIRRKLYAMEPMDDNELMRALQQYTFQTAGDWHFLPPEDQNKLLGSASLIDFLRVVPADATLAARFTEKLGHPIGQAPASAAPTIEGLGIREEDFDVGKQAAAVEQAVAATEQGRDIPIPAAAGTGDDDDLPFTMGQAVADTAGDFGDSLEV